MESSGGGDSGGGGYSGEGVVTRSNEELNQLSEAVLACAYRVHCGPGPGLLESVYKACLAIELRDGGFSVSVEHPCPVIYKGQQLLTSGTEWICWSTSR